MNLLIFSEMLYPHGGGAELATWLYSQLLADQGNHVTIVTAQFSNEPPVSTFDNGLTVYRLCINFMSESRYFTLANVSVLGSTFITNLIKQSDAVYVPCGWYSAIPIAKLHKKPVIVHMHNYAFACSTSLMYDFAEQKIGSSTLKSYIIHEMVERKRNATAIAASSFVNELIGQFYQQIGELGDALIFVSKVQRDLVLSKNPNLREKSYVISNPLPNIPFIPAETLGIGYFGGKSFIKGFYSLMCVLKSLQLLKETNAFLAKTADNRRSLKCDNGVILNFLPKIKPQTIMKDLSIVIIPSLCPEPSPYVLVESLLHGKLVVASNVGGIPEISAGLNSGVKLVDPQNNDEMKDAIESFMAIDQKRVNEIGIESRKLIIKRYSNEQIMHDFMNTINRVVT